MYVIRPTHRLSFVADQYCNSDIVAATAYLYCYTLRHGHPCISSYKLHVRIDYSAADIKMPYIQTRTIGESDAILNKLYW
jgi:hypothetical protein